MACAIGLSRILREDRATKDGFSSVLLGAADLILFAIFSVPAFFSSFIFETAQ